MWSHSFLFFLEKYAQWGEYLRKRREYTRLGRIPAKSVRIRSKRRDTREPGENTLDEKVNTRETEENTLGEEKYLRNR